MVHPVIEGMKPHFGAAFWRERFFRRSRQIRFHFFRRDKHLMEAAKTQHRGTRWLTAL